MRETFPKNNQSALICYTLIKRDFTDYDSVEIPGEGTITVFSILCWLSVFVLLLIVSFPQYAYAYIDPGTGSFIIQMIVAGALGAFFTLKVFWKKITHFVRNIFSKDT